ncbi:MAG: hypothetical protein F4X23_10310 [Gemmatimonadales bacterium]|nr:hypothetical protein [Gemmatimonadales bacterium]
MKSVLRGVATATIAFTFALPVGGQTLLRLDPPEGQVSRYVFSMEITAENPMMPASGPVMTLRVHQTRTILTATDEVIRGRTAIDSAAMTNAIPGAAPLPDLSGSVFAVEINPRGQHVSTVAEETPSGEAEQVGQDLVEGAEFFSLPEAEVGTGDSWTETVPVPLSLGGPAQTADVGLTYTLNSMEDGQATIAFTGAVESSLDMGGMSANVTGDLTGSMVVDLAEGRYVRQESRLNVDVVMAGMAIPTETTTTLKLVAG